MPPPTPEQAAVLAAGAEPTLVVAGAGSGKTETMAARVIWLVASGIVAPERILGLTFTRKAARQLSERIRSRLRRLAGSGLLDRVDPSGTLRAGVAAGEPTVLTYHAYAGRLLAEHGLRLPLPPGARLLSETASWRLAHNVVSTWEEDLDTDKVPASITAQVRSLAGELSEHLVSPDSVSRHAAELTGLIENAPRAKRQREALPAELRDIIQAQRQRAQLLALVAEYQHRKRAAGALDFADQMSLAARLATDHPEVVEGEQERYGAVLLDEYQDTGHAQRILLRALFGHRQDTADVAGANPVLPVTAVGDPTQAIYGWRGASAANLPRFATDFPTTASGEAVPAETMSLLRSFRNPPEVLDLANLIAEPLRARGLGVDRLAARDGAEPGDVEVALLSDVRAERDWIADSVATRWFAARDEDVDGEPPSAAVLVRRRADMAPLAAKLRERGLPVEVVGLGGLLDEPEVADLVATLRAVADPLAGTAAARLLTGARWRLGGADLAALWRRARDLAAPEDGETAERADEAGLVDALDDPGEPAWYSAAGYQRIQRLSAELGSLRGRMDQSLPEFVADVERTVRLDVEALARPDGIGRGHLDAFAEVAAEYAESSPSATLLSFLDYLAVAEHAEDGLAPGESDEDNVEVAAGRVQVLTVHAAKGLEWRIVAVPHLSSGVFPGSRRSSSWLKNVTELPAALRGDTEDLPELDVYPGMDRKEVGEALTAHEEEFVERHYLEERRLCYVALTRSERSLLVSGFWWNETSSKVKGPSELLIEVRDATADPSAQRPIGTIASWAEEPETESNPLVAEARELEWPVDPLGERRAAVDEGADLVRGEISALRARQDQARDDQPADDQPADDPDSVDDPDGWIADTDVLLAERARHGDGNDRIELPGRLSVSQLVDLATDADALAAKLRRPLPNPPNTVARRGTAFHGWLERRFTGDKLFEFDDLPGAADDTADDAAAQLGTDAESGEDAELRTLQDAFERSEWAAHTPFEVEVPFSTDVDGVTIRGRMDAVFADADGGWTVVDWKTGAVPPDARVPALAVQLAAYRLAWSELRGVSLDRVRAAFVYVRHNYTLRPVDLLDAAGLRDLLGDVPSASNARES